MTVVPGHHRNESPRMLYIASSIKTYHRGVIIPVYFGTAEESRVLVWVNCAGTLLFIYILTVFKEHSFQTNGK